MEESRYERFILAVDGIHKAVQKLKMGMATKFGLKGVHVMWLCELLHSEDGLTGGELSEISQVNRSLVSRELEQLSENGYVSIVMIRPSGYKARIMLTEKGRAAATEIEAAAIEFQKRAGFGVSGEDMKTFYETLERICENLSSIASKDNEG